MPPAEGWKEVEPIAPSHISKEFRHCIEQLENPRLKRRDHQSSEIFAHSEAVAEGIAPLVEIPSGSLGGRT